MHELVCINSLTHLQKHWSIPVFTPRQRQLETQCRAATTQAAPNFLYWVGGVAAGGDFRVFSVSLQMGIHSKILHWHSWRRRRCRSGERDPGRVRLDCQEWPSRTLVPPGDSGPPCEGSAALFMSYLLSFPGQPGESLVNTKMFFCVEVNVPEQLVVCHPWKRKYNKNWIFYYEDGTMVCLEWSSCPSDGSSTCWFSL